MLDQERYDLIKTASHETGHALVHHVLSQSFGTARVWPNDELGESSWCGSFQSAMMDLTSSVAGMVGESLFDPLHPAGSASEIVADWRYYERRYSGDVTALDDKSFKTINAKTSAFRKRVDPTAIVPTASVASESDMQGLPSDWLVRESLVERAHDVIVDNWVMFEWFRDGLMEFGTLTTECFKNYPNRMK